MAQYVASAAWRIGENNGEAAVAVAKRSAAKAVSSIAKTILGVAKARHRKYRETERRCNQPGGGLGSIEENNSQLGASSGSIRRHVSVA
jgi:hypothetical protein